MGSDKALLEVDGVPMAKRVADALAEGGCEDVVCVGGDQAGLEALGLQTTPDRHPGEGPLGGVLTALEHAEWAQHDFAVISACDHPWLTDEAVGDLITGVMVGGELAQAGTADGERPPLFFAARVDPTLGVVRDLFASGERSLRWFGARLRVFYVNTIPPEVLRDVDSPDDLP
jgi:molybdopterin-guanine dinucleotide biosynthesis protein A